MAQVHRISVIFVILCSILLVSVTVMILLTNFEDMYTCISGISELRLNYYSLSCPNAETIIEEQVGKLYDEHGNTAVSWVRNVFHDCMVKVLSIPYPCILSNI